MNVDEARKTPISDTDSENDEDCRRTNDNEFLELAPISLTSSSSSSVGALYSSLPTHEEQQHDGNNDLRTQGKGVVLNKNKRQKIALSLPAKKDIRKYYQHDAVNRHTPSNVTLLPPTVKSKCWVSYVWCHFKKFHPIQHPELKNLVACDICFKEAENNHDIDFTVQYQVNQLDIPIFSCAVTQIVPLLILIGLKYFKAHPSFEKVSPRSFHSRE